MSGKGNERQSFRYPAAKWRRLGEIADATGTDRSALIREFCDGLIARHDPARTPAFSHAEANLGRSGDTRQGRT